MSRRIITSQEKKSFSFFLPKRRAKIITRLQQRFLQIKTLAKKEGFPEIYFGSVRLDGLLAKKAPGLIVLSPLHFCPVITWARSAKTEFAHC